jgi:uncharacterized protein (TIGR00255 family)
MTGHGEAHRQEEDLSVSVEIRTINSRYFKVSVRCSEGFSCLDRYVEQCVRQSVRRGSVQINLQIDLPAKPDNYHLNGPVLASYVAQIKSIGPGLGLEVAPNWSTLLALPGAIDETHGGALDIESLWPRVEATVNQALDGLHVMRQQEGQAMARDLVDNCEQISQRLTQIEQRAPAVVESYRARLTERLKQLLSDYDVAVEPGDIVREIGIFAERVDISEELVRMRSHLEQFATIMELPDSQGRKLDFLTQEMFRETNTIGSKANDAEIARHMVEIKACIERMREMIQNVE